ncbi:MAG: phosphatase PAP2 family protein [Eubacteriaceae bacterium]
MDLNILIWIQNHLVFDWLSPFMVFISDFWGEGIWGVLFATILLIKKSTRRTGLIMLTALILSGIFVNFIAKPIFDRPRPFSVYDIQLLLPPPKNYSFPSGHAASVFAFVWAYFITRRDFWRWALLGFAILVSFSRLYLFVHYPTDVLAGIFLGIFFAYFSKWILTLWISKNENGKLSTFLN